MAQPPAGGAAAISAGSRILGLDLGDRRIGVALSDPLGVSAQPLLTLHRRSWAADLGALVRLVREHDVGRIVVGLPLGMDGSRGARVLLAEDFMQRAARATGLPVVSWDERLTTVQAERALLEGDASRARRRAVIDQVAAVILLQSYLDAHRVQEET
jgi:putative Holliday junction resolvase